MMTFNDAYCYRPYSYGGVPFFVNDIRLEFDMFKDQYQLTSDNMLYVRKNIHEHVDAVFNDYELDFYANPEILKKQIQRFCNKHVAVYTSIDQVSEHIAGRLVDGNGRNGRDQEFIFQGPEDVTRKLQELTNFYSGLSGCTEITQFCRAINSVLCKINWNRRFPNVINLTGDGYDTRREQIKRNLGNFFVTHKQDLSMVIPCIKQKKDILSYFLPPVFIQMEADNGFQYKFRRYKYEYKYTDNKPWYIKFSTRNLDNHVHNLFPGIHRFPYRNSETIGDFVLNWRNIIYLLQITFPRHECEAVDETLPKIVSYVGKASNGLLDRWCKKETSHMNEIWKVWAEMHISPSELSGQLVHCAVPYAHVMGYKTELYIVDHVSADDEERVKSRIEMAKEIIERSEIYGGDLEQVWLSMHPYTDWCLAEGPKTRLMMAHHDKYPPYEFVEWYRYLSVNLRVKLENLQLLLDVFEQWWITKVKYTAEEMGFNDPTKSNLPEEVVYHFYNLSKKYPDYDLLGKPLFN